MKLRLDNFKFFAKPKIELRNHSQIRWQIKKLNANITSNVTDIAVLRYSDLQIGKTYVAKVTTFLRSNTGASSLVGYNGPSGTNAVTQNYQDTSAQNTVMTTVVSEPFVAVSNLFTFSTFNFTASEILFGNNSNTQTYVVMYEFPDGYYKQVGNGGFNF